MGAACGFARSSFSPSSTSGARGTTTCRSRVGGAVGGCRANQRDDGLRASRLHQPSSQAWASRLARRVRSAGAAARCDARLPDASDQARALPQLGGVEGAGRPASPSRGLNATSAALGGSTCGGRVARPHTTAGVDHVPPPPRPALREAACPRAVASYVRKLGR